MRGHPFSLELELRYAAPALAVAPLVLRSGNGQATLTGKLPLAPADAWDLTGSLDALDLAPALAVAGLDGDGPATGSLRVTGPRDEPHGRFSLRADGHLARSDGAAPGVEDAVVLEVEGGSVGPRLEARAARGAARGRSRFRNRSLRRCARARVAASLEAAGLAWERLPLVPAPARRLTGTLAGRLSLDGRTSAPVGELALGLAEPRLDGAPLLPLALSARSDGKRAAALRHVGRGRARCRATGQLEGDWPLRLVVDAKALPYAALVDATPALKQAGGEVAGSGTPDGRAAAARTRRSCATPAAISPSRAACGTLDWRIAPFSVSGSGDSLEVSGLKLEAGKRLARGGRARRARGGEPASTSSSRPGWTSRPWLPRCPCARSAATAR